MRTGSVALLEWLCCDVTRGNEAGGGFVPEVCKVVSQIAEEHSKISIKPLHIKLYNLIEK